MKKLLFIFVMLVSSIVGFAQSNESEKAKPMLDTEIVRKCSEFDVEGDVYEDVTVTIKSKTPDYFFTDRYRVKVTVVKASGTKVWSKTFKNAFLFVFSNGQIQVGKNNFDQLVIGKLPVSGKWFGIVREKEGIYEW